MPGAWSSMRRWVSEAIGLAVDGWPKRVLRPTARHDGPEDPAGGADRLALLDVVALAEDHGTDRLLSRFGEAEQPTLELEEPLTGVGQAGGACTPSPTSRTRR
jgi:hypothetical protein